MNKQNDSKLKRQRKTNLHFIMKGIQVSNIQVFNSRYSWIIPRRLKTFDNTTFKQLSIVFLCKLLACVRCSAACFSLKTSTKDGHFSFSFRPEF